jgi:16S rRNA (adenine1518-N6/adenine1519-N6)-dimethyltransferase
LGRRLGQHFLIKGRILERIAAAACPEREPLVVEIGPGKGALTRHLLERADRVVAVELDEALAERLREHFAAEPRLTVITGDALEVPLDRWGPAVVAGNLPYYAATPIIERAMGVMRRGVFLVQKEVAARLAARPGARDYGYLTVRAQLFADVEPLMQVRPSAFHPPPKVTSQVVRLTPRARAYELAIRDVEPFLEFVGRCFLHKRKTLRNNLAAYYGRERVDALAEAGLRAEQISIEKFAALYRGLVG